MRRKLSTILLLCLALVSTGVLTSCGGEEEEELHAVEGEPLELGSLLYNVQITRFLNPSNADDAAYLGSLGPAPTGQEYLAVFMRVINESGSEQALPSGFQVVNSRGIRVNPVSVENPFALPLDGASVEPEGTFPPPDTPAASGPIKGSMLLFLVEQTDTENRPLELVIPGPVGESGTIELDI